MNYMSFRTIISYRLTDWLNFRNFNFWLKLKWEMYKDAFYPHGSGVFCLFDWFLCKIFQDSQCNLCCGKDTFRLWWRSGVAEWKDYVDIEVLVYIWRHDEGVSHVDSSGLHGMVKSVIDVTNIVWFSLIYRCIGRLPVSLPP